MGDSSLKRSRLAEVRESQSRRCTSQALAVNVLGLIVKTEP